MEQIFAFDVKYTLFPFQRATKEKIDNILKKKRKKSRRK